MDTSDATNNPKQGISSGISSAAGQSGANYGDPKQAGPGGPAPLSGKREGGDAGAPIPSPGEDGASNKPGAERANLPTHPSPMHPPTHASILYPLHHHSLTRDEIGDIVANAAGDGSFGRLPFEAARDAAPHPLRPVSAAFTPNGSVTVGVGRTCLAKTAGQSDRTILYWDRVYFCRTPTPVSMVQRGYLPVELRYGFTKPDVAEVEKVSAITKLLNVPTAQRAQAHRAISAALSGGSAVAWLARVLSAIADLACAQAGVYPAGTQDAATYWLAPPTAIQVPAVFCNHTEDWNNLQSAGRPGEVVLRLSSITDSATVLFAQLITRAAALEGPRARRIGWGIVSRVRFIVPANSYPNDDGYGEFAATGWRNLLPQAGDLAWLPIQSALLLYCQKHGLESELLAASALVQYHLGEVDVTGYNGPNAVPLQVPIPGGSRVLISDFVSSGDVAGTRNPKDVPLPRSADAWVMGCTVGAIAYYGAYLQVVRANSYDPTGYADDSISAGDLAESAQLCGGEVALMGRALSRAYGLHSPYDHQIGQPGLWSSIHTHQSPRSVRLEGLVLALFGVGVYPDTPEPSIVGFEEVRATRHPSLGDGVYVPLGAAAFAFACDARFWATLGITQPAPHVLAQVADEVPDNRGLMPLLSAVPEAVSAATLGLMANVDPPAGVPMAWVVSAPAPKSMYVPTGEVKLAAFFACGNAILAEQAAHYLTSSVWTLGSVTTFAAIGNLNSDAVFRPHPTINPRRRRGMRDAFTSGGVQPIATAIAATHLRESYVATPVFGEDTPVGAAPPGGPQPLLGPALPALPAPDMAGAEGGAAAGTGADPPPAG